MPVAGASRGACLAPVPIGLQVVQALGVKHLPVGAFGHLLQPVAVPAGGDPSRDARREVGVILLVELDEFRERGENSFSVGGVGARQQDRELVAADTRNPKPASSLDQRAEHFARPAGAPWDLRKPDTEKSSCNKHTYSIQKLKCT